MKLAELEAKIKKYQKEYDEMCADYQKHLIEIQEEADFLKQTKEEIDDITNLYNSIINNIEVNL